MSGLAFVYENKENPMDMHTVTERLCLTEDGERLVPEGDPDARWLYAIPGGEIPLDEAKRFGLVKPKAEPPTEEPKTEAARTPRKARARQAKKPAAK